MATSKPLRPARTGPAVKSRSARKPAAAQEDAGRSTLFVNSVEKAMRVLTAFDGSRRHLTLSQIAAATEMDMSSAQRFTHTLAELGYLRKDEDTRAYELTPRVFDFTYHYLASNELMSRATPYLLQLSRETAETSNITVLDGADIVFVLRIVSHHALNPNVIVGTRLPAYCTAPGLAMLACLDHAEVDALLAQSQLVAHTPHTVTQPRQIKARLEKIRAAGYAHTEEEYFLGDISTAAAIVDGHGRPVGAVNVAVARPRWGGGDMERRISDLLITTAAAISGRR
jgi:DNA-binding IclR family transcriptional regulator